MQLINSLLLETETSSEIATIISKEARGGREKIVIGRVQEG